MESSSRIVSLCHERDTIRYALDYLDIVKQRNSGGPGSVDIEYVCAYLASEQLQNADVLASEAISRCSGKKKKQSSRFWRLLARIEDQLVEASSRSSRDSLARCAFKYKRLERYKKRCRICEKGGFPCIVSGRTAKKKKSDPSYKCQPCFARKAICTRRSEAAGDKDDVRTSSDESEEDELDDDIRVVEVAARRGPRAPRKNMVCVSAQSTPSSSPDNIPVGSPVGAHKPGPSTTVSAFTGPSVGILHKRQRADSPRLVDDVTTKRHKAHAVQQSPSISNIAVSVPAIPRFERPAASTAAPTAPSPDDCLYVEMAYEKALHVITHVEQHGCEVLRLRILVRDMGGTLKQLVGVSFEGLDADRFDRTRERVKIALRDVAAFNTESLKDVELQGLICQLKMRLGDLLDSSVAL